MTEDKDHEKANDEEPIEADCKNNVTNVVYSIKPLCCIQSWCGVVVFRTENGQIFSPDWRMKALGLMMVLIYCSIFLFTLNLPMVLITGTSDITNAVNEIPGIVVLIQYVFGAIISSYLVNKININVLNTFAKVDNMLCVEIMNDFYKKSHSQTIHYLIALLATHGIICVAAVVTAETYSLSQFADLPLYFFQKCQMLIFCKMIVMLKTRLILINEYITTFVENIDRKPNTIFSIRDVKDTTESKFNFIGRPTEKNTKIQDLATIYDLMGKIGSMINEAWNFQIFMTLVSTFINIVITIWTSLHYYRKPENSLGPLTNMAIWSSSIIFTVAVMCFACERLLVVRNETRILVNKVIMNYDLPKSMRVQAKAFMELIEAWPLRIYIYDMFSVDITLMLKFISVATTYLIVIIQISHLSL